MDTQQIYQKLPLSIRRINDDEIEIRQSGLDGSFRGKIRYFLICLLLAVIHTDVKYNRPVFSDIYNGIYEDFTWAFNPDKIIMPLYRTYQLRDHDPDYFKKYPEKYPPMAYKEYRKPYLNKKFWRQNKIYLHCIWIPFLIMLICLPRVRGLRINRKHRIIYTSFAATIVPDKGDPLSGLVYDRFGRHLFGGTKLLGFLPPWKYFAVNIALFNGKRNNPLEFGLTYGVYPTPNVNHNLHIIKAMREFLSEDNPEFLQALSSRYARPRLFVNPLLFFCNAFALPSLVGAKRTRTKALKRVEQDWNTLSDEQQNNQRATIINQQHFVNEGWKEKGFINEVNDDWNELDTSPLMNAR